MAGLPLSGFVEYRWPSLADADPGDRAAVLSAQVSWLLESMELALRIAERPNDADHALEPKWDALAVGLIEGLLQIETMTDIADYGDVDRERLQRALDVSRQRAT